MGKQYNKVEKRKRRKRYIKRQRARLRTELVQQKKQSRKSV